MKKQTKKAKKVTKEKDIFDNPEFKAILNEYYDTDIDGEVSIKLAYIAGYREGMKFAHKTFRSTLFLISKNK